MDDTNDIRELRLEKARTILRNAKFIALPKPEQRKLLQSLVDKGLDPNDLRQLVIDRDDEWATTLEKLPYDVFISVILAGDIHGKELISLCNSAPRLNEKCNRTKDVNGQPQEEFLFVKLLERMGKHPSPNVTPRRMYKYYTIYVPKIFAKIERKIREDSDYESMAQIIFGGGIDNPQYPQSLSALLYHGPAALLYIGEINSTVLGIKDLYLEELNIAFANYDKEILAHSIWVRTQALRDTIREDIPEYLEDILVTGITTAVNFRNMIERDPEYAHLRPILAKYDYEEFSRELTKEETGDPTSLGHVRILMLLTSIMHQYVDKTKFLDFTDEEINFIISLHYRVLSGELSLAAPFTLEGIL